MDDQIRKLFFGGGHDTVLNPATGFEDKVLEDLALNYLERFVLSKLCNRLSSPRKTFQAGSELVVVAARRRLLCS